MIEFNINIGVNAFFNWSIFVPYFYFIYTLIIFLYDENKSNLRYLRKRNKHTASISWNICTAAPRASETVWRKGPKKLKRAIDCANTLTTYKKEKITVRYFRVFLNPKITFENFHFYQMIIKLFDSPYFGRK
jgi:hypothetical protein